MNVSLYKEINRKCIIFGQQSLTPTTVKRDAQVTNGGREGRRENLRRRWKRMLEEKSTTMDN